MQNFDDFIEQVREANPIEDLIQESGIPLRGHGRLRTATKHDSMKVRTDMQRVFWYSQNWNGDVFGWVMREKGCEFKDAVEILARRAHIEMPKFKAVNESEVQRTRATADAFSVAADVFHRWLVGDKERGIEPDADALAYVKGRAWTDETIAHSLDGFSGRKTDAQVKDMRGELQLYGVNLLSPAAIAILGFEGDVDAWARAQGIRDHEDFKEEWCEKKRIHGLMDTPGLIYVHQHNGGVRYLSRRNLPGFDKIKDGKSEREWKSFNPHKSLVGPKQVYFNHMHRIYRQLVLVEGQGDAQTWGQWGHGSMAFCGLLGDIGQMSPEDGERFRRLIAYLQKHPALYLALDDDEAGQKAIRHAAKALGPKIQIVHMTKLLPRGEVKSSTEETTDAK
jgi:DNA primase